MKRAFSNMLKPARHLGLEKTKRNATTLHSSPTCRIPSLKRHQGQFDAVRRQQNFGVPIHGRRSCLGLTTERKQERKDWMCNIQRLMFASSYLPDFLLVDLKAIFHRNDEMRIALQPTAICTPRLNKMVYVCRIIQISPLCADRGN